MENSKLVNQAKNKNGSNEHNTTQHNIQDVENFVQCAAGFDEGLALVAAELSHSGERE